VWLALTSTAASGVPVSAAMRARRASISGDWTAIVSTPHSTAREPPDSKASAVTSIAPIRLAPVQSRRTTPHIGRPNGGSTFSAAAPARKLGRLIGTVPPSWDCSAPAVIG
jgi:hypothetical protein